DPRGPGDEPGVGHRVGGARQQVGQADRFAERTGQDREREIEAPADLSQQVAKEIVSPSHARPRRRLNDTRVATHVRITGTTVAPRAAMLGHGRALGLVLALAVVGLPSVAAAQSFDGTYR